MATYPRSTCDFAGQIDGTNLAAVPTSDGGTWRKTPASGFGGDLVIHNIGGVGYVRRNSSTQALYLAADGPAGYAQRARIKVHVVTANDNSPTVVVRSSDDGNSNYIARWSGNSSKLLQLIAVVSGGVAGQSSASYPAGLVAGQDYWIEVTDDEALVATLYAANGTTVLATCSLANTQIKLPGLPGIRFGGGAADTVSTGYRIGGFTSEYSPRTVELVPASAVPSPYARLRVPAIVETPDYLLCLSEARYTDESDTRNRDCLLWRVARSAWATVPAYSVLDNSGSVSSAIAMDPCGAYLTSTGRTLVILTRYPAGVNETNAVAGLTGNTATLWLYGSDDQGATWDSPVDITAQVKLATWTNVIVGPSNGLVVLPSGRIVGCLGYTRTTSTATEGVYAIISDDDGATWSRAGEMSAEGNTYWESQICVLGNNDLLAMIRYTNTAAEGEQQWVKSSDQGVTWAAFVPTTNNPVTASVTNGLASSDYGSTSHGLALHSGPNDAVNRVNLAARYSTDLGVTWNDPSLPAASTLRWPAGTRIASGGCGYSSVAGDPSGDFFVLYEHPQAGALALSRIDRTWLGVPEPPALSVGSPAAMMMGF